MSYIDFSQYKNIFGEPGKGLHQYKFKGTSLVDYGLTILGAFIVTYYTDIPLVITTIVLLILGILFHSLFRIRNQALRFLGY